MSTVLPNNRKWIVATNSDVFGSIAQTKNLDFDNAGYLALAKKAITLYSESDDADFKTILAIGADQTYLYVLTESALFAISLSGPSAQKNKSGSFPALGLNSDLVIFNGYPHISGTQTVSKFDPSQIGFLPWTQEITGLSTSYPHPMEKMENRQTLLVGDGNVVHQYDTTYSKDTTNELTIPADYIVVRIIYRDNYAYILTRNIAGGNAKLFKWNGVGTGHNGAYAVNADWIYSGCEHGSYVAVVTSAGQLLDFNGAGFTELPHLPVYAAGLPWSSANVTASIIGNVASRGMEAIGQVIYLNINGGLNLTTGPSGNYLPSMPSGLWKCDPAVGTYHCAGPNYEKYLTLQPTDIESNALTFSSAHGAETGDAVLCSSVQGITGVNALQTYYAIVMGSSSFQLALSPAEAKAGEAIPISGTPTSLDLYMLDTYDAFGGGEVVNTGAVYVMKHLRPNEFFGSRIFFGARTYTNSLGNQGALMSLGYGRNRGYFVTPKIPAGNLTDTFQKLFAKLPQLNLDSDAIVVKYRKNERFGTPSHTAFSGNGATFTSPTTFTINPNTKDVRTAQVGDEVEFISGAAAGYLAHITEIDTSDATSYIFTLDETLPVSNGDVADFVIDCWTKAGVFTNTSRNNSQNYIEQAIETPGTWVQLKVELRGHDLRMEELMLATAPRS